MQRSESGDGVTLVGTVGGIAVGTVVGIVRRGGVLIEGVIVVGTVAGTVG